MYSGFNKSGGDVIGRVVGSSLGEGGELAQSLTEMAETTAAEEALLASDEAGNPVGYRAFIDETGELSWRPEDCEAVLERTVAMSQMTSMLRDSDRCEIYEKAISKCIAKFIEEEKRAPSVLDIGSGTGLLSMIATRHGAAKVIGCEMFTKMASIAEEVVDDNGLIDKITIISSKSSDVKELKTADIIVSELLDSALLGESCMLSHADAIDRLYKGDSTDLSLLSKRVIPNSSFVYGTLVESDDIRRFRDTRNVMMKNCSPDRENFDCSYADEEAFDDGEGALEDLDQSKEAKDTCVGGSPLIPVHWTELQQLGGREISETKRVMDVEFFHGSTDEYNLTQNEDGEYESTFLDCKETQFEVSSAGTVNGVLIWWELNLLSTEIDPNRECVYSTAPGAQKWQDHWTQVIYALPEPIACEEGDVIVVKCCRNDIQMWFDVQKVERLSDSNPAQKKFKKELETMVPAQYFEPNSCTCGWHMLFGAERLHIMNDAHRNSLWDSVIDAVSSHLNVLSDQWEADGNDKKLLSLDVSDGSIISLGLANHLKSMDPSLPDKVAVVSLERKEFSRLFFNSLVNSNNLFDIVNIWDGLSIMDLSFYASKSDEEDIQSETFNGDEGNVDDSESSPPVIHSLISECFYFQLNSLPVWEAVSFCYQKMALNPLLHPSAVISPSRAMIMIAPVELPDLSISHGLASVVSGFDHSALDKVQHNWYTHTYPYRMGTYRHKLLSEPICVTTFDYVEDTQTVESAVTAIATENGLMHGFVIWVDYVLLSQPFVEEDITLKNFSDGKFPFSYKTNVKFIPQPLAVTKGKSLTFHASFSLGDSEVTIDYESV